jgi:beta-glucosidase
MNGRPLALQWADANVDAILEAWYPGTIGGHAIADVLFGDYNPSAKLPVTFPRTVGQVPLYYNMKNTGRPYDAQDDNKYVSRYLATPNDPLYPFGYGLSYTQFEYSDVNLDRTELRPGESLTTSVIVTNTGEFDGEEVVQLYVQDLVGSVTRPVRQLKAFEKIHLKKGESRRVSFTLGEDDLAFYRHDMTWGAEPGDFRLYIGTSSQEGSTASFTLLAADDAASRQSR